MSVISRNTDRLWNIDGEKLTLWSHLPHTQVLPFYPNYEYFNPAPGAIADYRDPANSVGHTQRAFIVYWALRGFIESGLAPGIDLGGAGVPTPGCISVDMIGTGEVPAYGGTYDGVHIKADASRLLNFGNSSFSSIVSNHLIEHLPCRRFPGGTQAERLAFGCDGSEILLTLNRWMELLRPGGYIAAITPDEKFAKAEGTSFLFTDETHQHAFDSTTFIAVLEAVSDAKIIEYDTFDNQFSFNFVLQKNQ